MKRSERLWNVLYPNHCVCQICNKESADVSEGLCDDCKKDLTPCGTLPAAPPLSGCAAGLVYTDATRLAIHQFKYGDAVCLTSLFAAYMEIPPTWRFDTILPVPLHPIRKLLRGYNQSERLARALKQRHAMLSQIPIRPKLLKRTRYTPSQTAKTGLERKENVRNAFCASSIVKGKSILLIDDVFTTGATLRACAEALHSAGALRVYALCAAATAAHDVHDSL